MLAFHFIMPHFHSAGHSSVRSPIKSSRAKYLGIRLTRSNRLPPNVLRLGCRCRLLRLLANVFPGKKTKKGTKVPRRCEQNIIGGEPERIKTLQAGASISSAKMPDYGILACDHLSAVDRPWGPCIKTPAISMYTGQTKQLVSLSGTVVGMRAAPLVLSDDFSLSALT
ncbi:hypothetical protein LZ30DRAFT_164949 [Colletotrichum cereale]|nr:hypothetical protein LZ30DRAFT_164949 [Colletotrichum cereale]